MHYREDFGVVAVPGDVVQVGVVDWGGSKLVSSGTDIHG